jgi:predicted amidohydrolase
VPRKVVVSTVSHRPSGLARTVAANVDAAVRLAERAATVGPDLVCLPEHFSLADVPRRRAAEVAEPVPGPTTERLGAVARRHRTYLVCPLYERAGGHVFNAAVLLDRNGGVAGVYRKVHPTLAEMDEGVVPGERVQVFEADFGRVGLLICFDIAWAERWRELRDLGAEVVCWPSTYEGGLHLQARAADNRYYVVSATLAWHAHILDVTGFPLASTGQRSDTAWAEIDLEKRVFSTVFPQATYDAIATRYGRRVTLHMCSPEGVFTLESHDPAVAVADLMREFGLEALDEHYYVRSAAAQAQRRLSAPVWG